MKHLDEEKKFTMGIAYTIVLIFFIDLEPLRKSELSLTKSEPQKTDEDFFFSVCRCGDEGSVWVDAVRSIGKMLDENLPLPNLSEKETFLATIQFVKTFNDRPEVELSSLLKFVLSMYQDPDSYPEYWALWEKTRDDVLSDGQEIHPMHSFYDHIKFKKKHPV